MWGRAALRPPGEGDRRSPLPEHHPRCLCRRAGTAESTVDSSQSTVEMRARNFRPPFCLPFLLLTSGFFLSRSSFIVSKRPLFFRRDRFIRSLSFIWRLLPGGGPIATRGRDLSRRVTLRNRRNPAARPGRGRGCLRSPGLSSSHPSASCMSNLSWVLGDLQKDVAPPRTGQKPRFRSNLRNSGSRISGPGCWRPARQGCHLTLSLLKRRTLICSTTFFLPREGIARAFTLPVSRRRASKFGNSAAENPTCHSTTALWPIAEASKPTG